ncbi:MAG: inositol monophosphatase [Bacteroidetes bacterium]|nr:inositol monophosphatase [Bacteroidota bacterium]
MEASTLEDYCMQTREAVALAATFIREKFGEVEEEDIEHKGLHDLVSFVDTTAEEMLVENLAPIIPDAGFLTEEGMVSMVVSDYRWIIDPLDGTTNFLHGLPCFSVSVALEYKGEYLLGVVHEINQNECFYAWKGGGAWMNENKIEPAATSDPHHSLIATGFPYHDYSRMAPYLKVLEAFMRKTRGLRRFGSAAVDLAYVACGRFDGFFEYRLNPWDIAAGAFIVQEAGGVVTDFSGGETYKNGNEILAASKGMYSEMLDTIQQAFKELES